MLELHGGPDHLQLFEHPLHGHLLDGFVHDVVNLVLEIVEVQGELPMQKRLIKLNLIILDSNLSLFVVKSTSNHGNNSLRKAPRSSCLAWTISSLPSRPGWCPRS